MERPKRGLATVLATVLLTSGFTVPASAKDVLYVQNTTSGDVSIVDPVALNVVGTAAGTVVANRNRLTGNTAFGVNNLSAFNVDATRNWWGAPNGPGPVATGSGDRVTTNVTYAPWLRNPSSASCGEGGDASERDGHDN